MDLSEVRTQPRSIAAQSAEELEQLARTLVYVLERSQAEKGQLVDDDRRALNRLLPEVERLQKVIGESLTTEDPASAFGLPLSPDITRPVEVQDSASTFSDPNFQSLYQPDNATAAAEVVNAWEMQGRDTSELRRALFEEGGPDSESSTEEDSLTAVEKARERTAEELLDDLMTDETASHSMNGTTRSLSLDTVFQFLARSRRTGRLLVRTNEETMTFALLDGDLVFTATDTPRPGQRLGELLIEEGRLDTGELARALGERNGADVRIGQILEDQLEVPRDALSAALQTQARLRYERARDTDPAAFAFFPGPGAEEDSLRMKVLELLLESVRLADERQRPAPPAPQGAAPDGQEG